MHSLFKGVFLLALVVLATCTPTRDQQCQSESLEDAKKAERALADFAINLYKNASGHQEQRNEVISPVSIALALALLENGADGHTRQQLQRQLLEHGGSDEVLQVYRALQKNLEIDEQKTRLEIANGIFHDKSIELKERYTQSSQQCLDARVQHADFEHELEESRQKINEWVSQRTSRKIQELIKRDTLERDTRVVLANALHFKASWERSFDQRQTRKAPFYRQGRDEDSQEVSMMKTEGEYRVSSDERLQVVELRYDQAEIALYVLVPKQRDGLKELERRLNGNELRQIIGRLSTRKAEIHLPKFAVRSSLNLKQILKRMGVEDIFSEDADFRRMTDQRLKISEAVHEAYIKVDEKGTEAAAATGIAGVTMTAGEPTRITADHPFLYTIVHSRTGAVVFIGKVNEVHENADE